MDATLPNLPRRKRAINTMMTVFKDKNPNSNIYRVVINGRMIAVRADGSRVNGHTTLAKLLDQITRS